MSTKTQQFFQRFSANEQHSATAEAAMLQFERRIIKALAFEWQLLQAGLHHTAATHFREPAFALHDLSSTWGLWRGKPISEISISRRLVYEHPWYAVVEVLRHEMAHQLAEECLGGVDTPHGDSFQRACRLLGANPAASGNYPPVDEYVLHAGSTATESDRLMHRIRKLLALSESSNRHEAELALSKAHELMAKYNLDVLEHDRQRKYVSLTLGTPRLRQRREDYALAGLLRDYHFVRTIWIPRFLLEQEKPGRILEISGTCENVQLAHYAYDFVQQYTQREWRRYQRQTPGNGRRRSSRRDFALGVIQGFREKLQQEEETDTIAAALVKRSDRALDSYFQRRHPRIRNLNRGAIRCDRDALESGVNAGRNLNIHKGVQRQVRKYLN